MTDSGPDAADADIDANAFGRALLAANAADPGDLLDRLRAQLLAAPLAIDLTMHLIDYRLGSLRPVTTSRSAGLLRPEPVTDSPAGTAFRLQRPTHHGVPAGVLWHVPMSVRGQRLGVLTATFAADPGARGLRLLNSLALAGAYSLLESSAGTDVFEVNRRHGRLSLAAEMQWQLLPARAYQTTNFYVAGHLEPALRVAGDAFDFVVNDSVLTLAVIDATGTGGAPSLLTTLVVTALRNARRSGLALPEQASLAGDIIWHHSRGDEHASVLLVQLDAQSGLASAVDAGSPAIVRMRQGRHEPLPLDPQTPLGMFDGTEYHEQPLDLQAGDRAYVLTDGAFADGRHISEIAELLSTAEGNGTDRPPPETIRQLVTALTHGGDEPEDDITIVCVDWTR